jgi:hypothetical protein
MFQKIKDGMIGDLVLLRAYRQHNPVAFFTSRPKPPDISELLYQVQRFHSFLWASGGCYSDFYIHNIDECCWMKDAWPVVARASGGRHYHNHSGDIDIDQNFDVYSVEYTFADGAKLLLEGRCMNGCDQAFASFAHGTKGSAVISINSHWPSRCRLLKSQHCTGERKYQKDVIWKCGPEKGADNPYQVEWDHLLEAIRQDKPYNEVERGAKASLVTSMGRMAAHTGQVITYDQMLTCEHEFAPDVDKLKMDAPAPLLLGADGKYPVPEPGRKTTREY